MLDFCFFILTDFVGFDVLMRGAFCNLANTFNIQNVVVVMCFKSGLINLVDNNIIKLEAIQVVADNFLNRFTELFTVGQQVFKLKLFNSRFKSFGKLRCEVTFQVGGVAHVFNRMLCNFQDIFFGWVYTNIKINFQVGTNIVFTMKTFVFFATFTTLATTLNRDFLSSDVHVFMGVDDWVNNATGQAGGNFCFTIDY